MNRRRAAALAGLTALVLAAHVVVLQGVPLGGAADPAPALPPRPFATRMVAPPPAPKPPPPPAVVPRPPAPKPVRPAPADTPAPPVPEAPAAGPPDTVAAAPAAPAPVEESVAPPPAPPVQDPVPAAAAPPPPPLQLPPSRLLQFDVNGRAKGFSYNARAELRWQHDDTHYEARQQVSAFLVGSRTQTSQGTLTPQGLAPVRFADKSRSEQAAHFDYERQRVTFSANTPDAPMQPGMQDRLSVFLQLAAMLAGDPARYPAGTQIALPTAGARDAETWVFVVEGEASLDLPVGATVAWRLSRSPRREFDQKAEIWLAPALGYLPARIRLEQANGDVADLLLRAVE